MPDSCRTSPNPELGQAFLDHTVCTLTCTLSYTISKTGDRLILRPFSQDSPGSASTGGPPSEKSQKQFVLATQNPDSGRELTESNLLSEFVEQKSTDCTVLKLDNPRIGLDRKSGQAISDHEIFTKGHRLDFHSGKTVNSSVLRVKTGDSPGTVSTGRSPLEKGGVGILFPRRESVSLDSIGRLMMALVE